MSYNWDYLDTKAYNNRVGQYKFRKEFEFIVSNTKDKLFNILDIGGGSGRFAIPLRKYSNEVTVVDINETALQLLKQRDETIRLICTDFMELQFQEKFTTIICIEALGYFEDLEAFFRKVETLLADDGRLILHYNNPNSWRFFLRKLKHWKTGKYQYNEVNLKSIIKIISGYNLQIESMSGMNWLPLPLSSNCRLVSLFEKMEKLLHLSRWHAQSPWIMMAIKKTKK